MKENKNGQWTYRAQRQSLTLRAAHRPETDGGLPRLLERLRREMEELETSHFTFS